MRVSVLTATFAAFFVASVYAGNFYQGVSPTNLFWPGGIVPYVFATNITPTEQVTYLDGLREWELAANIHFVPYSGQSNWIQFQYAPGTFLDQYVPYTTPETVTISVLSRAQICHEMGHALGFTHENIRIDKDTYIAVLTNNINTPSNIYWFTIDPTSEPYGPYDYESVMHLANNFDAASPNLYTQLANAPYRPYQPFMGNLCLSHGDRASAAYLYGPPAVPLTNIVTTTADGGAGSLRAAIYYAMDNPGSTVRFNIPTNDPGYSNGVYTIYLTGFLPPLMTNGTIIDGSTQPGFAGKPLIFIDGSRMIPEAYNFGTVTGLYLYTANCQVRNLAFQNFNWNGITISYPGATNNTIAGCWCGVDYTGTNAASNAYQGILIYNGASGNIIGGANALERNVLSGNGEYGLFIDGTNTADNLVCGNYIGTDASGKLPLSDVYGGMIITDGAYSNVVGGAAPGSGNLLSGNSYFALWIDSLANTVQGNWIGLDATGTNALPNDFGMFLLYTAESNAVVSNVISGNYAEGCRLAGPSVAYNTVRGNYFGTDATGSFAIPNGFGALTFYSGASSNTVGGLTAAARNIISGSYNVGLLLSDTNTDGNLVAGNYIGLDASGTSSIGNDFGIWVANGAQSNIIGGLTAAARNVISGNNEGIFVTNLGTSDNVIEGNYIGPGPDGVTAIGNSWQGVIFQEGASDNILGPGNVIVGNGFEGVALYADTTVGDTMRGNNIFSNGELGINLVGGTENFYGVTANHVGGAIPGPNDLQNYPVISNVVASGASTTVSGSLNSGANRACWIDCYRNIAPDPSGYGQGQFYLGSVPVTTDASGNATFTFSASGNFAGQYFSATATDQASGDTSEFSLDVVASNAPTPPAFVGPFTLTAAGFKANVAVTAGQTYQIQTSTNLAQKPVAWTNLTNFVAGSTNFNLIDPSATNSRARFYRVVSP